MDQQDFGAYLVVKVLSKNWNEREKYICVPMSWVKVNDSDNNKIVVFGYPSVEDRLDTRLEVIKYQPPDTKWPTIYGEVVFHTDSHEDAFRFLETEYKSNIHGQLKDTSEQDDKEEKLATSSTVTIKSSDQPKKKRGRPRKRKPSDQETIPLSKSNGNELEKRIESEILEAQELIRKYANDNEEVAFSSTPERSHNVEKVDTTEIFLNATDNDMDSEGTRVNNKIAKKIMPRRKSIRRTKILSDSYLEFSDEDGGKSDDSNYTPKIIHPKPSKLSGQSVPAQDQAINMNLMNDHVYSECYNFYVEFNDSYQKSMSILDNAENYLQNLISKHNENIAAIAKSPSSSPTYQQSDIASPTMFSHPQPLLEERFNISVEDTKWTLRYPEPGLGIIELMPNTGVYVSDKGLNECKSISNETTQFTRALLEEIFTDEALKKCSFTGYSRKKTAKKFGLDQKARETFVDYILKYSFEMGWERADPETVMSCIRNRLQTLGRSG